MHTETLATNGFRSRDRPANASDFRFRKAVCRVLIALSFKSFRRRNERYRRRERSDCSEARILPIVEEERPSEPDLDSDNFIVAAAMVTPLTILSLFSLLLCDYRAQFGLSASDVARDSLQMLCFLSHQSITTE